jgi:hypothetical protein
MHIFLMPSVVGWNLQEEAPRRDIFRLFGVLEAFTTSMEEEQGQKTLHAHLLIWVRESDKWREDSRSANFAHLQSEREQCYKGNQSVWWLFTYFNIINIHWCNFGI